jgi:hypothetical protein
MFHARVSLLVFALALAWPTHGQAGFVWLDDGWKVTLDMNIPKGVYSKQRAFGASATEDGQVFDVAADVATAKARTQSFFDPNGSFARARVNFERDFRLEGDPGFWLVTLQGVLSGRLTVFDPDDETAATVFALARVSDTDGELALDWGQNLEGNGTIDLFEPMNKTLVLPNGDYTVSGLLDAFTILSTDVGAASADSDFFNAGSFVVAVSAAPVPEPSSSLGAVSGGLLLIMVLGRRRRPPPASAGPRLRG